MAVDTGSSGPSWLPAHSTVYTLLSSQANTEAALECAYITSLLRTLPQPPDVWFKVLTTEQ